MKKLLVILMSLLLLTGCASTGTANKSDSNVEVKAEQTANTEAKEDQKISLDKLTLTYVTSPLNVPSIVEKQKEIFKNNLPGVEVEYAEITSGADQTQALASGDVNVLYALGGSSAVAAYAGGGDVKILNMYSRAPKAFCMFSKDPALKSAEDLKGKTIAGPMGTNLHELLVAYLRKNNMTLDDVNFTNMAIPDALAGLEGGSVDVALLGGPAAYKAEKAGYNKIADGEGLIEAIICVATSQKFYDEHKDVIDAIRKGQEEVIKFMNENPEETKELVKAELKLDDEAYNAMFPQYNFDLKVNDSDIAGLQKTADFMYDSDMIKEKVDVNEMFIK